MNYFFDLLDMIERLVAPLFSAGYEYFRDTQEGAFILRDPQSFVQLRILPTFRIISGVTLTDYEVIVSTLWNERYDLSTYADLTQAVLEGSAKFRQECEKRLAQELADLA